jgi:hypothetical protein
LLIDGMAVSVPSPSPESWHFASGLGERLGGELASCVSDSHPCWS